MTVQDRCGQSNDLPPVMQFLSANQKVEIYSSYLLGDKVSFLEFGGGYYRKEKVAEIQYAIVYVKATVEYEVNQ